MSSGTVRSRKLQIVTFVPRVPDARAQADEHLKGKKGTIVINVSAKFRDASGKAITAGWVVAHATGAYRGLTGTGTGNGHELTSKPALTHLNVFRGSVRTARVATSQSADAGLAAVRRATAKYIDPKRALADGYVPLSPCIGETGLGAMGMHYGKPSLLESRSIDPFQPELLLTCPSARRYDWSVSSTGGRTQTRS